jgi:exonuclease III
MDVNLFDSCKNADRENCLTVIHQNIRGLCNKSDELVCSFTTNQINPPIICLSEHYLSTQNLLLINLENYYLGCSFSCTINHGGGVCIYVRKDMHFVNRDVSHCCVETIVELCAVQVDTKTSHIVIICIYRSVGNFEQFLSILDTALKYLYRHKTEFLICGDVNINYLLHGCHKAQLSTLLNTFNVTHSISFPSRIYCSEGSAIDNIFIDIQGCTLLLYHQ